MFNIAIVFAAICIVAFLIYAWFRGVPLPPNARLLFEAWAAVERETINGKKGSPKTDRDVSPVPNMNKV